jgi:hypothetical protein
VRRLTDEQVPAFPENISEFPPINDHALSRVVSHPGGGVLRQRQPDAFSGILSICGIVVRLLGIGAIGTGYAVKSALRKIRK